MSATGYCIIEGPATSGKTTIACKIAESIVSASNYLNNQDNKIKMTANGIQLSSLNDVGITVFDDWRPSNETLRDTICNLNDKEFLIITTQDSSWIPRDIYNMCTMRINTN